MHMAAGRLDRAGVALQPFVEIVEHRVLIAAAVSRICSKPSSAATASARLATNNGLKFLSAFCSEGLCSASSERLLNVPRKHS